LEWWLLLYGRFQWKALTHRKIQIVGSQNAEYSDRGSGFRCRMTFDIAITQTVSPYV
jgi:hypothetical protein